MKYGAAELEQAFAEHIRAVSQALARVGAEYMLISGLAVGVWVEPRATKHADFSVRVRPCAIRLGHAPAPAARHWAISTSRSACRRN